MWQSRWYFLGPKQKAVTVHVGSKHLPCLLSVLAYLHFYLNDQLS